MSSARPLGCLFDVNTGDKLAGDQDIIVLQYVQMGSSLASEHFGVCEHDGKVRHLFNR